MLPSHFKPLYSTDAIGGRVKELGTQITTWADKVWEESHTDILAIPILRGGLFFFSDLTRAVARSMEIAPARTWGYNVADEEASGTQKNTLAQEVQVDLSQVPAQGRAILLVDDICDSGRSLKALSEALIARGAREVKSVVLVRRKVPNQAFTPNWSGFDHDGPEWMVGYGMDDGDRFRNLPAVYIISQGAAK